MGAAVDGIEVGKVCLTHWPDARMQSYILPIRW